jgi:hypothetical protein
MAIDSVRELALTFPTPVQNGSLIVHGRKEKKISRMKHLVKA